MGLDIYIVKYNNKRTTNETSEEVFYARKFWELLDASFLRGAAENCRINIPITKENVEELIQIAVENRDYFGEYNNIPKHCEVRDSFDYEENQKASYYFEAEW